MTTRVAPPRGIPPALFHTVRNQTRKREKEGPNSGMLSPSAITERPGGGFAALVAV